MQTRVLFLTVMPSPYQQELFQALHADGRIKIRVLYCSRSAPDRNWVQVSLSPYEQVLSGTTIGWLGPSAHLNPGIAEILKKEESDLFVLGDYSAPTTQIAMRLLSRRKKRWVFWGEVPGFNRRGHLGNLLRQQLQRPIANGATAIAAIGSEAVDVYQTLFPHIRVFNIPYFCNLARFKNAVTNTRARRKGTVDVLFSGQLIERKGVDLLIQAFAQIADKVPEMHLQLLGTGPAQDALSGTIPLGLRHRIHFLGFQQPAEIPGIFSTADMFVLPSRHDGWGVVVNEALGAGLPIIVSDRVGARDLVEDGCNGFVARAGDVDSLAGALLALGRSRGVRNSFGCRSAKLAETFDVDEGVRRWVELAEQMIET